MEQSDLNLLQNVPPYHLQAIVKSRRLPHTLKDQNTDVSTDPSAMTIPEIAQYLFEPLSCREAIQGLQEVEQLILRELVSCGGRANSRDLALYLTTSGLLGRVKGTEPPLSTPIGGGGGYMQGMHQSYPMNTGYVPGAPVQYPTPHPHGAFEQALHRLLLQGLLFWGKQTNVMGRDYANGVYDGVLIVPLTVVKVAREVWGMQDEGQGGMFAEKREGEQALPLPYTEEGARVLQRTLYLYWSLAAGQREGLPLVSNRMLSRAALRQVMELLGPKGQIEQIRIETEVPHLLFIRLLLMKLGLLYERQNALYAAPAESFFALPQLERTRRCYRVWLESVFWNELAYLPEVIVRPAPGPFDPAHEELVHSRQVVVERVLHEQPGEWHELSAFIARTKLYAPYLLFPRQYGSRTERYSMGSNPYGWDFRLRRGWLTHREGWHLVEGGFIRAVVSGSLHWLGLVEVNDEDNPTTFRFTPGIFLVTGETTPGVEELPAGRLIVQPNFELVALAPVSEALLVNLDRFAERVSLEHIAQYRLTKASVTRAIQMGLHAETMQQVLEQAVDGEIPQNVQYSLVEWERQARRIELWRGVTLLEVDDEELLDALFADEELRPLLGRRLAPLLVEVAADQLARVQEALWQRGHFPALTPAPVHDNLIENGRFPAREPQWRLHEDGTLQPCHPVLDFYLKAELEHITELDETTGGRKVTPTSIQQACSAGLPLEHILRFLQSYCEGGVLPSFLVRLRLWGGGYGEHPTIQVEPAPLLSLPAQVLQDLQTDEVIGQLLGTELAHENRLVHVSPDVLERVMELLRKRGFTVL